MSRGNFLLGFILIFLLAHSTQAEEPWEARLQKTCPNLFATLDRNGRPECQSSGTGKCALVCRSLSLDFITGLSKMRPVIQSAAKTYDISPQAIVAVLMSEYAKGTYLPYAYNLAQRSGYNLGKSFGYPLSNLVDVSNNQLEQVERFAAKMENRKIRNNLSSVLSIPEMAIPYIAALLKKAQIAYKDQGIDLSQDLSVWVKAFKDGDFSNRAAEIKASHRALTPDATGFFLDAHRNDIESIAGRPLDLKLQDRATDPNQNDIQVFKVKNFLSLSNGPNDCFDAPPFSDWVLGKSSIVRPIGTAIDCNYKPWILVSSGETTGWVEEGQFTNSVIPLTLPKNQCQEIGDKCNKIRISTFKNYYIGKNEKGEMVFSLRNSSTFEDKLPKNMQAEVETKFSAIPRNQQTLDQLNRFQPLTKDICLELRNAGIQFVKRVVKAFKFSSFEDVRYQNPYKALTLNNLDCNSNQLEQIYVDKEAVLNWLNSLEIKQTPSSRDLEVPLNAQFKLKENLEIEKVRADPKGAFAQAFKQIEYCQKVAVDLPESSAYLYRIKEGLFEEMKAFPNRSRTVSNVLDLKEPCLQLERFHANSQIQTSDLNGPPPECVNLRNPMDGQLQMKLTMEAAQALLKTKEDEDDSLLFDLQKIQITNNADYSSLRQLADGLASFCTSPVFVPDPWLGSEKRFIYRPSEKREVYVPQTISCTESR